MRIILNIFFTLLFICKISFLISQSTEIYIHPSFESFAKKHKVIAILPFDVTINMPDKVKKTMEPGELELMGNRSGFQIQSAIQNYFRERKVARKANVVFQDCSKTDGIIMNNSWSIDSIYSKNKNELADTLGVDAIISGSLNFYNLRTLDAEAGTAVLGFLNFLLDPFSGMGPSPTDSIRFVINIYDGKSSELLWKYNIKAFEFTEGEIGNGEMHNVINSLMFRIRKAFPYKKKYKH